MDVENKTVFSRYVVSDSWFPLAECHHIEHFTEEKMPKYVKQAGGYMADYGYGAHKYINIVYVKVGTKPTNPEEQCRNFVYVVATELLTEKEHLELRPYCRCEYHATSWYNPLKALKFLSRTRPEECGCLESHNPVHITQVVIDQTRRYYNEQNKQNIQNKNISAQKLKID